MSKAIAAIEGIVLSHMVASPELKEATLNILRELDNCLESADFDSDLSSDELDIALDNLDNVLVGKEEEVDVEQETDEIIKHDNPLDGEDDDSPRAYGEN